MSSPARTTADARRAGEAVRRVPDRSRPLLVQGVQRVEQPAAGVRVGEHVVQAARAPLGGVQRGRQLPGPGPPLAAPAVQVPVEAGQQGAGQVLLGREQFGGVRHRGRRRVRGRTGLDAVHQGGEIPAVHGRVVEPLRGRPHARRPLARPGGAVAVGVQATTARTYDGATAARLADALQAELPGPHPGMRRDLVEGVREDVEPGGRRAFVGALERVDLFQASVGLDDDEIRGGQAQGLGEARPAVQRGQDGGEDPHRHRPPELLPAVEDREEPVGVGGGRSVRTRRMGRPRWHGEAGSRCAAVPAR